MKKWRNKEIRTKIERKKNKKLYKDGTLKNKDWNH